MPEEKVGEWHALQSALENLCPDPGGDLNEEKALLVMGEIICRTTSVFGAFIDSRYGSRIPNDAHEYQTQLRDLLRLFVFSHGFVGAAASVLASDIDALQWGELPPRLTPKPKNTSKFRFDDAAMLTHAVDLADFIRSLSGSNDDYVANLRVYGDTHKTISPTWVERLRAKLAKNFGRSPKYNKQQAGRSFLVQRELSERERLEILEQAILEFSLLHYRITKNLFP